jgi:hypothetical protein
MLRMGVPGLRFAASRLRLICSLARRPWVKMTQPAKGFKGFALAYIFKAATPASSSGCASLSKSGNTFLQK